ncbi:hypothetical protein E3N88_12049 [Mikania micrantha]|uniref:Uncharacterized protein n=1 Tax=Mikania micrantha TaxID=192012 RepID=A0A5N6P4E5_9ASTR|nr:hypothetical protein E3N88_12049 [Mikania micrantha]
MLFWDGSFFNNYVPDLNEEPPVEYSYGPIDLNVEPHDNIGFESQAPYAQQSDYRALDNGYIVIKRRTKKSKTTDSVIKVINNNHKSTQNLEGHPYVRRFTQEEQDVVENMTEQHMDPRNILSSIKKHNPTNVSIFRDV